MNDPRGPIVPLDIGYNWFTCEAENCTSDKKIHRLSLWDGKGGHGEHNQRGDEDRALGG